MSPAFLTGLLILSAALNLILLLFLLFPRRRFYDCTVRFPVRKFEKVPEDQAQWNGLLPGLSEDDAFAPGGSGVLTLRVAPDAVTGPENRPPPVYPFTQQPIDPKAVFTYLTGALKHADLFKRTHTFRNGRPLEVAAARDGEAITVRVALVGTQPPLVDDLHVPQ